MFQTSKAVWQSKTNFLNIAGASFLAVALLITPTTTVAQSRSDPTGMTTRGEIADYLGQSFHEEPVAGGLATNGTLLEVFTSPNGESWTIILTRPDGSSQVVAVGETWLELRRVKGEGI